MAVSRKHRERVYAVLMSALMQERMPWAQRLSRMKDIWDACFG